MAITKRGTNRLERVQVKTIIKRERNGIEYYVMRGIRGSGAVYTQADADYMVGVIDGKVYMTRCRALTEYWARADHVSTKWRELPIN